jgi:hypothetical protein
LGHPKTFHEASCFLPRKLNRWSGVAYSFPFPFISGLFRSQPNRWVPKHLFWSYQKLSHSGIVSYEKVLTQGCTRYLCKLLRGAKLSL